MKLKKLFLTGVRAIFYFVFCRLALALKSAGKKNKRLTVDIAVGDLKYKMLIEIGDNGISDQLFLCGIREVPNSYYFVEYIKKNINKIFTFIDLGANIGYYVLLEKAILNREGVSHKIFAIEPIKSNFNLLAENIILNNFKNVILKNVAIGESNKKVLMVAPRAGNLSHVKNIVKTIKAAEGSTEEVVDMWSLEYLFEQGSIKKEGILFRWDIEGYEYQILKYNQSFFQELKNVFIVMEFHPFLLKKEEAIEFLEILKKVGFELDQVVSCYPLYFIKTPKIFRSLLNKVWQLEKKNDPIGKINRLKNIDILIEEVNDENSPIYNHPQLHLYLRKK